MLYEVITDIGVDLIRTSGSEKLILIINPHPSLGKNPQPEGQRCSVNRSCIGDQGEGKNLVLGVRITSYNVCYTKLLRNSGNRVEVRLLPSRTSRFGDPLSEELVGDDA